MTKIKTDDEIQTLKQRTWTRC